MKTREGEGRVCIEPHGCKIEVRESAEGTTIKMEVTPTGRVASVVTDREKMEVEVGRA